MSEAAAAFEAEAVAVLGTADVDTQNKRLERIVELQAHAWILANAASIKADITRARQLQAIDKALATTKTNRISSQSRELTEKVVTAELRKSVSTELEAIDAGHLQITVAGRPTKGTTLHKLDIKNRKVEGIALQDIVSEGEYRAIALASFLAELGQSADRSAIVVDDPVSSLDHIFREKIAKRITSEAANRQVIVFTHDVLFLKNLIDEAETGGVEITLRQITRGDELVGLVSPDVPWDTQSTKQRLDFLRRGLANLKKVAEVDKSSFELLGRDWYGHVRETWELVVEEMVLNKVVQKLSFEVQTKRLKKVVDLTEADYASVEAGMAKSSRWLRGHLKPFADSTPFPLITELEADLKHLESFYESMKKRR